MSYEIEEGRKNRQKVIKRLIKERRRNFNFQYITKYISRGDRESLRILYIKDKENRIIKTMNDRIEIEAALI